MRSRTIYIKAYYMDVYGAKYALSEGRYSTRVSLHPALVVSQNQSLPIFVIFREGCTSVWYGPFHVLVLAPHR